jgi:hypothetical protein
MVKAARSETVAKGFRQADSENRQIETVAKLRQVDSEIRQIRDSSKT